MRSDRLIFPVLLTLLLSFTCHSFAQETTQPPANVAALATALLAAQTTAEQTTAEQTALLTVAPQFVTAELCRELAARGEVHLKQRQFDPALAAFQLTLTIDNIGNARRRGSIQAPITHQLPNLGTNALALGAIPK